MLRHIVSRETQAEQTVPQEGELFKILRLWNCCFPLYYGYYEECDRKNPGVEPMPIYPDFIQNPQYTEDGFPFVTKMQDICSFYLGKAGPCKECADCHYYFHGDELMGICTCLQNRRSDHAPEHKTSGHIQLPPDE